MIDEKNKFSSDKVSKNALNEILQGKIKQTPKWFFVLKNIILWFVGMLCIIAGALTVSLIIFTFVNSALFMHSVLHIGILQHLMIILPLLWIILAIVFIIFFDIFVRHTKHGYKYPLAFLVITNIVVSIVMGTVFYFCGISHFIDDMFGNFRHYHNVENRRAQLFDAPDKGVIVGRVIKCGNEYFILMTPHGNKWYVIYENVLEFENTDVIDGQMLMIFGKKIDDDIFAACEINKRCMHGENPSVRIKHMSKIQKKYNGKAQLCQWNEISKELKQKAQSACLQK